MEWWLHKIKYEKITNIFDYIKNKHFCITWGRHTANKGRDSICNIIVFVIHKGLSRLYMTNSYKNIRTKKIWQMTIQRNYMANTLIKGKLLLSLITQNINLSFMESIITLLINI